MKAIGFQLPAAGRFRLDAFGFISRNSMAMIIGLRPLSPFWLRQAPTSPIGQPTKRKASYWAGKRPTSADLRIPCGIRTERYYITPWAEPSNRPEGGADHRQNPWLPGPQARRRHQPSRRSRVNLREYSQAPIPPQKPTASNDTHSKKAPVIRLVLLS